MAENNVEQLNQTKNQHVFDSEEFKCPNFLAGLSKCKNNRDIVNYVNSIVDSFPPDENTPKNIGTSESIISTSSYVNGGEYNGFIYPSIKISYSTIGYSYHIYDRNYLYSFAYGIRKLNLPNDALILRYVMNFLDSYFGFPKETTGSVARKDDAFYDFATAHAEEFYKKYNIPIDETFGAVDQMQLSGEFPLSALKGKGVAECAERAALAQNILKLCGYNSSIMYGECESRGQREGHSWNVIYDKNGNMLVVDYSNTVYSYKNGQFIGREPYACSLSKETYESQNGILNMPDYSYVDGKRVREKYNRKYAIGKSLDIQDEIGSGVKL